MTIYLTDAIPNGWLLTNPKFTPLLMEGVIHQLSETNVVSLVEHSTTQKWKTLFSDQIPVNLPIRGEINPVPGDKAVAGLFVPPYQLPDGQQWSEDQILANTHWVLVEFWWE